MIRSIISKYVHARTYTHAQLLRSLTAVPSFSRFINTFVRRHLFLLSSSLSFLLEDGAQLLDLATKTAYLSQQLAAVRNQVRSSDLLMTSKCVM